MKRGLLWLILSASGLAAQDASLARRDLGLGEARLPGVKTAQSFASGASPVGSVESAAQADAYGEQEILVRLPGWEPWSIGLSSGWEYQSNASLSPNQETKDTVFRQTASVRAAFQLSETLYLDTGVASQSLRYDELDVLDLDRVDVDIGLLKSLPESWPMLGGSVLSLRTGYYRLNSGGHWNDALFHNYSISPGLLRSFTLSEAHAVLLSLNGEISLAAADATAQRNEYSTLAAWQARWSSRWESSLYARVAFYDYDGHDDWNLTTGAALDRVITPWCKVGLSVSWSRNESSNDAFAYENTSAGALLRISLRF
jgi:hypothetical protein